MRTSHFLIAAPLAAGALPAHQARAQGMDGKTLFAKNCAACHQATGKGIPSAFPALATRSAPATPARATRKARSPDYD